MELMIGVPFILASAWVASMLFRVVPPVSYTHLDVYKRQSRYPAGTEDCDSSMAVFLASPGTLSSLFGATYIPVSYTHLKRRQNSSTGV